MANKNLFNTAPTAPIVDTLNNAGGVAYNTSAKHTLSQIAATNCFNGTFYASSQDNLKLAKDAVIALKDDPTFIAKVAIYSRDKAYMKDMPAFLTVFLSAYDKKLFRKVFRQVVDNGKMLRNVIQMARSGAVTGKKANMSAGTWRKAIQEWFNTKNNYQLFKASIGNDPSMRDILRMARPKPNTEEKEALFGYFLGKDVSFDKLPENVQKYEKFKKDKSGDVPDVDFRMLDSLGLSDDQWMQIALRAPWMMTRMNINTFARHGVFKNKDSVNVIAERLRNKELIEKSKAFPYQLYVAWREVQDNVDVPGEIKEALQDAMEIAIDNVPAIPGVGLICVDMSGSMGSPITGNRPGSTSKVMCSEVAALIASSIIRKNKLATVYTFSNTATRVNLNPRDSVVTNTKILNSAGGGTNISAPMIKFNQENMKADWILYVSDNESWLDRPSYYNSGTTLHNQWIEFVKRNKKAKMICCDLTPINHSQIAQNTKNVLKVGGFSDTCFDVIASFIENGDSQDHWTQEIEKISLN